MSEAGARGSQLPVFSGVSRSENPPRLVLEATPNAPPVKKNEEASWVEDYSDHAAYVHRLARSLISDPVLAEDLEQAAWTVAWRKRQQFLQAPRAWITRVTRNLAFNLHRGELAKRRRQHELMEDALDPAPGEESEGMPVVLDDLLKAMAALKDEYRVPLRLRYEEELSPPEISERLGLPLETVRTRLKRGRQMLRSRMDERHGDRSTWAGLVLLLGKEPWPAPHVAAQHAPAPQASLFGGKSSLLIAGAAALTLFAGWSFFWKALAPVDRDDVTLASSTIEGDPRSATQADLGERQAVDTDTAALVVRTLARDTSLPIGDVSFRVEERTPQGSLESVPTRTTGRDGVARIDTLEPGRYLIRAAAGEPVEVDVAPGDPAHVDLFVGGGVEITGRVMAHNAENAPAVGAAVWVSWPGTTESGRVVTHADERGEFVLQDVSPSAWIGSWSENQRPSELHHVGSLPGEGGTHRAHLILGGREQPLLGIVRDERGNPVAGARVRAEGNLRGRIRADLHGGRRHNGSPQLQRTAADGSFRFDHLAMSGKKGTLHIEAPGYGHQRFEVTRGEPALVTLQATPAVEGRLRTASGGPAAGARVSVSRRFGCREWTTVADEAGVFRLEGFPCGPIVLRANLGIDGARLVHLDLAPGKSVGSKRPLERTGASRARQRRRKVRRCRAGSSGSRRKSGPPRMRRCSTSLRRVTCSAPMSRVASASMA